MGAEVPVEMKPCELSSARAVLFLGIELVVTSAWQVLFPFVAEDGGTDSLQITARYVTDGLFPLKTDRPKDFPIEDRDRPKDFPWA